MRGSCLSTCTGLLLAGMARADSVEGLLTLPLEALARTEIRVATGTPRTVRDAPAVTSVITAQEIEAIGAQHMDDALKTVPGLHVSHGSLTYHSRYYFRGIFANLSPYALVLVDGVPMGSLVFGDPLIGWQGVPVAAILRIEVIRGPGSAVYGADAFGGVINIITRTADTIARDQASLAYGSFDTRHASLLQRRRGERASTWWSVDYRQSDGDDSTVAADWATGFDQLFGTSSSLAPGPLNLSLRALDLRAGVAAGPWQLRASWQQVGDLGTGPGLMDALDPVGRLESSSGNLDLTWRDPARLPGWELEGRVHAAYKKLDTTRPLYLLPPGSFCYPGSLNCFPDGLQEDFSMQEVQAGTSFTALHTAWQDHRLRVGLGFFWGDLYRTTDRRNFDDSTPGQLVPLPGLVDVSDTPRVLQRETQRTNAHAFVQDEWQFARDWELTTGVRVDEYSDFGSTTNPRLALVWATTPTLTTKLLYGEAFRAPSFGELTNAGALGNPNLQPEKLRNEELALSWRPASTFSWDLNVFRYRIRDIIVASPDPGAGGAIRIRNVGRAEGKGVETELRYQLPELPVQLLANFSTARMRNEDTGQDRGQVPRQIALLRATWDMAERWQLSAQVMHFGKYEREVDTTPPDPRPDMEGYDTFDLSLRTRVSRDLELSATASNLFDADVREASNGPAPPQTNARIPGDLPQPGRSLTVRATLRW